MTPLSLLALTGVSYVQYLTPKLTIYLSKSQVDMIAIKAGGSLGLSDRIVLQGAHGDDIVRSILINDKAS